MHFPTKARFIWAAAAATEPNKIFRSKPIYFLSSEKLMKIIFGNMLTEKKLINLFSPHVTSEEGKTLLVNVDDPRLNLDEDFSSAQHKPC